MRDAILAAPDRRREPIELPEWGVTAWVQTMSGRERDAFEARFVNRPLVNFRASLAVVVLVDELGNRIFTDADADALGEKCGAALDRVYAAGCRLNGIGESAGLELRKN